MALNPADPSDLDPTNERNRQRDKANESAPTALSREQKGDATRDRSLGLRFLAAIARQDADAVGRMLSGRDEARRKRL